MIICAYCKTRIFESDRKCQACGSAVFIDSVEVRDSAPPQRQEEREKPVEDTKYRTLELKEKTKPLRSPKNRWLTLLLCLCFGMLGIHRFYVGKVWTGILFLLTLGFFGFGVAVDGFVILFGYFRDSEGLLLR